VQRRVDHSFNSKACASRLEGSNGNILEFSMLEKGVWAEVIVGGEHLRLFSEHNAQGVQTSVFNVVAKNWIAPSQTVDDIEQGKDTAEAHARAYLLAAGRLELPPLEWKESRSA
jgi:hypothetical protein